MDRNPIQQVYDRMRECPTKPPFVQMHWDAPTQGKEWFLDVFVGNDQPSSVHLVIQWNEGRPGIGVSRVTEDTTPFDYAPDSIVPDVDACVAWILSHVSAP